MLKHLRMMRRLMPTPLKDIPPMANEQKDFDENMLQAVALGNLPFSFVELAPLLAALQKLRPSVELASMCELHAAEALSCFALTALILFCAASFAALICL